jgi:hypothetical protein
MFLLLGGVSRAELAALHPRWAVPVAAAVPIEMPAE